MTSRELLEKAEILYMFVDMFYNHENISKDYGTGELFSMTEIHILNAVYKNPGITSSELVTLVRRTKGFVSQVLSKMEEHNYIIRVAKKDNAKYKSLYVTAEGQQLCIAHNEYDEKTLMKTYDYLLRDCSADEIAAFYKVMQIYINIMNAAAAKRRRLALADQKNETEK